MTAPSPIVSRSSAPLQALTRILAAPLGLFRSPLTRNGYALVVNAALTSVLGVAFWGLAARLFTAEEVGVGGVLISTMVTLSSAAQLNLGNVLNRFLPRAGSRSRDLILISYGLGIAASILIGVAFVVAAGVFVPRLSFLTANAWLGAVFVGATIAWTIFALQDSALAGLREAVWVPLENTAYSIAKLIIIVALAGSTVGALALLIAWVSPVVVLIVLVNLLIFGRLLGKTRAAGPAHDLNARAIAVFFGWDYLGGLAMVGAIGLAPLLVLNIAGAAASGAYYIAWTICYSLYLLSRSMGISLLAEGAADDARVGSLAADALVHTMAPLILSAVGIVVFAPWIMAVFGPAYVAEGTTLLRVLAIASIPWGVVTIQLSIDRARGRMASVVLVQAATLALVLAFGVLLLPAMGVAGMGVAWLLAHLLVVAGVVAAALYRHGRDGATDWVLAVLQATVRAAAMIGLHGRPVAVPEAAEALRRTEPPGSGWQVLRTLSSLSDATTSLAGERDTTRARPRAVLKTATSAEGRTSLLQERAWLEMLDADPRLRSMPVALPQVIGGSDDGAEVVLLQTFLDGEDGRKVLASSARRAGAMNSALAAIADVHRRTAAPGRIDEAWLEAWVRAPAALIARPVLSLLKPGERDAALAAFVAGQERYWRGRTADLGLGHGDYAPDNVLFSGAAAPRVAGVVDWGQARADAPAGLDGMTLILTTAALASGSDLGAVVRHALADPRSAMRPAFGDGIVPESWTDAPGDIHALAGLAWLQHSAANIRKSRRYETSRLWAATNVERVLSVFLEQAAAR